MNDQLKIFLTVGNQSYLLPECPPRRHQLGSHCTAHADRLQWPRMFLPEEAF